MEKVIKNLDTGSYYRDGEGFTGTIDTATRFDSYDEAEDALECARKFGHIRTAIENIGAPKGQAIQQNANGVSYAVSFVRARDVNADGSINRNRFNPSPRRFATIEEARHHGNRFVAIENHRGFYVSESRDPVNAYINKATGKTNPEIGKGRTNR